MSRPIDSYIISILRHDVETIQIELREILQSELSLFYFKRFGLRTITIHARDIAETISESIQ